MSGTTTPAPTTTDTIATRAATTSDFVTSRDGTRIAYDRTGSGPAVVLVPAVLSVRGGDPLASALVAVLAENHTVYTYDRRGRGESGNTAPYAVDREIEDVAAVIEAAGGTAYAYGISSGGVLALRAALALPSITKVAVYEPPFIVDDKRPPLPDDYVEQVETAVAEGRRGDAVELLMTKAIGVPAEFVSAMRADPSWAGMEAVADTIGHDGRIIGDTMSGRPLSAEFAGISAPTLVVDGGDSEQFMHDGADALAALLPDVERRTLAGQDHAVDGAVLAPVLSDFFGR